MEGLNQISLLLIIARLLNIILCLSGGDVSVTYDSIEIDACSHEQLRLIEVLTYRSIIFCSQRCLLTDECTAFKYDRETFRCELRTKINQPAPCTNSDSSKVIVYQQQNETRENSFQIDMALFKENTQQSSTFHPAHISQYGITGNCISAAVDSFSHTQSSLRPMWYVDLERIFPIKIVQIGIVIFAGWDRFSSAYFIGSTTEPDMNDRSITNHCANYAGPATRQGENIAVPCKVDARYVSIILDKTEYLEVCQFKVFVSSEDVFQLNLDSINAMQSSDYSTHLAKYAITGSCDKSNTNPFSTTAEELLPRWYIDLQQSYQIRFVQMTALINDVNFNRLHTAFVSVSDTEPDLTGNRTITSYCAYYKGPPTRYGELIGLDCKALGRFISVTLNQTTHLSLCEFRVFGVKLN